MELFKNLWMIRAFLITIGAGLVEILTELDKLYPDIGLSAFLKPEYLNEGLVILYTTIIFAFYRLYKVSRTKLEKVINQLKGK